MKAQSIGRFVDRALIDIPNNLRKLDRAHVENIKVSIAAKEQLVPVILKPKAGGRFDLHDGQHRLAALDELGITQVKYDETSDDDAAAIANMVRKQFTFGERIGVVMSRSEESDADLAAALGVTERKVKQYRQLATLPAEVIAAVNAEKIPASVATYLTMAPKKTLDDLVKALRKGDVPWWVENDDDYRRSSAGRRISTDIALFDVKASGIGVDIDLFQEDGGWFQDPKAFFLHQKKAAEEIGRTISSDVRIGVNQQPEGWWNVSDLRKSAADVKKFLNDAALAKLAPLYKERDEIDRKLKALKGGYNEELSDRNDKVLFEIARIESNPSSFSKNALPKDVKVLGYIDSEGIVEFKLYVPKKAEAPAKRVSGSSSPAAPAKPLEAHTKKAWRIARDHRSLQVQAALAADPLFALRVTLASFLSNEHKFGQILDRDRIQTDVQAHAEALKKAPRPAPARSFAEAWARVAEMPLDVVTAEFARLVAPAACVTGYGADNTREDGSDAIWRIVLPSAQGIVPATPLPPEYFEAHQTAQLLKLLKTIKGAKEAKLYEGKPKKKVAEAARAAALEAGWLPAVLQVEKAKPKAKSADKAKPARGKVKEAA